MTHPINISSQAWEAMMADYDADVAAALRAEWSANRAAQHEADVGVYAPLRSGRIRYALGIAGLLAVFGAYQWATIL